MIFTWSKLMSKRSFQAERCKKYELYQKMLCIKVVQN